MKKLKKIHQDASFAPDYVATAIEDINFEQLAKEGITHVAFDADSTLVPFRGKVLDKKTLHLLKQKRNLFVKWCVASNRVQNDLQPLAKSMDAQVVRATVTLRKPQQRYFKKVIDHLQAEPENIAMIGDKLFADVWGANRAGIKTVWIEHIGPDSPWDWVLRTRFVERLISRRYNS